MHATQDSIHALSGAGAGRSYWRKNTLLASVRKYLNNYEEILDEGYCSRLAMLGVQDFKLDLPARAEEGLDYVLSALADEGLDSVPSSAVLPVGKTYPLIPREYENGRTYNDNLFGRGYPFELKHAIPVRDLIILVDEGLDMFGESVRQHADLISATREYENGYTYKWKLAWQYAINRRITIQLMDRLRHEHVYMPNGATRPGRDHRIDGLCITYVPNTDCPMIPAGLEECYEQQTVVQLPARFHVRWGTRRHARVRERTYIQMEARTAVRDKQPDHDATHASAQTRARGHAQWRNTTRSGSSNRRVVHYVCPEYGLPDDTRGVGRVL